MQGAHQPTPTIPSSTQLNMTVPYAGYALKIKDARIKLALKSIDDRTPADIGEIAARFNLSRSRFRHLFKSEVGISLRHYLKLVQLERAKALLENSFFRVKEIVALVGINDISHFTRDYKARYRLTPSQTRARSTGSSQTRK